MKKGIKLLTERNDIVTRPAEGGSCGNTIQGTISTKIGQLQDEDTYVKLFGNPTSKYRKELELLVNLEIKKDILSKKESRYLIPESCKIPVIYTIPKIHKNQEHPPGRPIVNGIDLLRLRMGQYIDYFI